MKSPDSQSRREFLIGAAGWAAVGIGRSLAAETDSGTSRGQRHRITLAQVPTTRNVTENLGKARAAFLQARKDGANWILFSEGFLSGYYTGFEQEEVAAAFEEVRQLCRECQTIGLIGTGWKEAGRTYNQIRIVNAEGQLAGQYAKTNPT